VGSATALAFDGDMDRVVEAFFPPTRAVGGGSVRRSGIDTVGGGRSALLQFDTAAFQEVQDSLLERCTVIRVSKYESEPNGTRIFVSRMRNMG